MIQLKSDCLIIQTTDGQQIPCSAEWVTLELMGEGAEWIDPETVRHASAAVLHYFKHELQRPIRLGGRIRRWPWRRCCGASD